MRVNTHIKVKTHGEDFALPPEMGGGVKDPSGTAESEKDAVPPPAAAPATPAASAAPEATPAAAAPAANEKKAAEATPPAPDASAEKSDAASAEVKVVVPKAVPAEKKGEAGEKDEKKVTEDPEEPADKPEEKAMKEDDKPTAAAEGAEGDDKDKKKATPAVNEMGLMHDGTDIMKTPGFLLDAAGIDEGGDNLSRTLDAMQTGPCEERLNMTEY